MAVPVLNDNGITLIQCVDGDTVGTTLLHESGQWISGGSVKLIIDKQNMQGLGSAITYAKRYSLSSILGLATEEDDDGNTASSPAPLKNATPVASQPPPRTSVPRDPAPTQPDLVNDDEGWRAATVPSGKNKGRPLGSLSARQVSWYVDNYDANEQFSDSVAFRAALDEAKAENFEPDKPVDDLTTSVDPDDSVPF